MSLRKCIALLTACLLLCGALPTTVWAVADLYPLKNGGFENGTTSWQVLSGAKVTSAAKYEGSYGCHLTGEGDWDDLMYQNVSVLPGYTYTLSFWYKAQTMGVSWYLRDGDRNGMQMYRGWAGNTSWTQVTREFIPTEDTVTLLFRGSGSNVAESFYLDSVMIMLMPCEVHIYDNDCDAICNVCAQQREIGDHVYDHDCDIYCNSCGHERPPSGKHTYDFPCATLCNYCGAPRVGEGDHTYDDVCDEVCNFCSEVREVPHFYEYLCATTCYRCGDVRDDEDIAEELHIYDDIYDADCNHCGHLRVPAPKPMERLSYGGAAISTDANGLSFRFFLDATDVRIRLNRAYIAKSGNVCRYNDGVKYKLVRVGAVMSNEKNPTLDFEHLTARTIDVRAGYLCKVETERISFAVRIVNIPSQGRNTTIYARPYYIYSDGKEEIVVYGDTQTQTFNNLAENL